MRLEIVLRNDAEISCTFAALRLLGTPLACELRKRFAAERQSEEIAAAHAAENRQLVQERAVRRAENHVLTRTQAELLAAVRAGVGTFATWGTSEWRRVRSMGGARARMRDLLTDEGLLSAREAKLTSAGLARLVEWENSHYAPWSKPAGEKRK